MPEEDLVIGEEGEDDVEYAETTISEYIACAYNVIEICNSADLGMISKAEQARIAQTKRKAFRILHYSLAELYSELFDDEED